MQLANPLAHEPSRERATRHIELLLEPSLLATNSPIHKAKHPQIASKPFVRVLYNPLQTNKLFRQPWQGRFALVDTKDAKA